MVECNLARVEMRVRFPLPAHTSIINGAEWRSGQRGGLIPQQVVGSNPTSATNF
jgi:hypothetical protein